MHLSQSLLSMTFTHKHHSQCNTCSMLECTSAAKAIWMRGYKNKLIDMWLGGSIQEPYHTIDCCLCNKTTRMHIDSKECILFSIRRCQIPFPNHIISFLFLMRWNRQSKVTSINRKIWKIYRRNRFGQQPAQFATFLFVTPTGLAWVLAFQRQASYAWLGLAKRFFGSAFRRAVKTP